MQQSEKSISEFLDTEYLKYSMYVVENRAIPSMIDGFKTTQRKIAETTRRVFKTNSKAIKVVSLTGELMSKLVYHHGDSSGSQSIIGMAQEFKNSLPLLEGIGQFGSLRNQEPGAPRYISVKPSKWFNIIYKDNDLLKEQYDDGVQVEPLYFLPIIPMILVNGGSGIAVGYASDILNRNPKEIVNACLEYLQKGKIKQELKPWWKEFKGSIEKNEEKGSVSWILKGSYEIKNGNTLTITELPPSMSFEKIETLFNKLEEEKFILSYEDNSKDLVSIDCKFTKSNLSELTKDKIESKFKLIENITENITCLNEYGKIEKFEDIKQLIRRFVDFRLSFYAKRKELLIKELSDKINKIEEKIRFIQEVLESKIIINKRKRKDIEEELIDKKYVNISYLLGIPLYSFTKDELEKLNLDLENTNKELDKTNKILEKDMYISDLSILLKELK